MLDTIDYLVGYIFGAIAIVGLVYKNAHKK